MRERNASSFARELVRSVADLYVGQFGCTLGA